MNQYPITERPSAEPDVRKRSPPGRGETPGLTSRATPGRKPISASLRSDVTAIAKVIAMSWIR